MLNLAKRKIQIKSIKGLPSQDFKFLNKNCPAMGFLILEKVHVSFFLPLFLLNSSRFWQYF